MIHFENDRIAYHIERQLRRGRSKDGIYSYLSDKNFIPVGRFYKYEDCFDNGLFEALNLI